MSRAKDGAPARHKKKSAEPEEIFDIARQSDALLEPDMPQREVDHFIPAPEQSQSYRAMLQGTGTNKLTQISTRKNPPSVDAITGLATIADDSITVFIERYHDSVGGLRVSSHKLLDACMLALTAQNDYRSQSELKTMVSIPLEEYMTLCGKPLTKSSKDETRKRIKEDLNTLYSISLEWSEPDGKATRNFAKIRVISSQGIKNGRINVGFSPEIAAYLTHAYIMQYPLDILKIDERNPSAYYLGKKLLLHHSIDNNQIRGTADIISVRALLDCCPDIPSYEEVMSSGRQLEQRIIAPFESALDMLGSTLIWDYCNPKKIALSREQAENISYENFIECYIHFQVRNAPDQSSRLLARGEDAPPKNAPKKRTYTRKVKANDAEKTKK